MNYKVMSPTGKPPIPQGRTQLSPPVTDLNGKTICAMRHMFRADETFPMLEKLFKENYRDITWVSNHDMPDVKLADRAEEAALRAALEEKRCDVLLVGNGA